VNGLTAGLLAGGGTLLAMVIVGWLLMRGGCGRPGILLAFAAGSVLGIAGILWNVVVIGVSAGGQMIAALLGSFG
jgi:hypothetical protein